MIPTGIEDKKKLRRSSRKGRILRNYIHTRMKTHGNIHESNNREITPMVRNQCVRNFVKLKIREILIYTVRRYERLRVVRYMVMFCWIITCTRYFPMVKYRRTLFVLELPRSGFLIVVDLHMFYKLLEMIEVSRIRRGTL